VIDTCTNNRGRVVAVDHEAMFRFAGSPVIDNLRDISNGPTVFPHAEKVVESRRSFSVFNGNTCSAIIAFNRPRGEHLVHGIWII